MILYMAGSEPENYSEMIHKFWTNNALTTYFTLKDKPDQLKSFAERFKFKNYFLDSWAYWARTRWKTLDVIKYWEYLKSNLKYLDLYANLDDKNSEEKTMSNLKYLESIWLKPLPVWHVNGWNYDLLRQLLDKYDYIAIWWITGDRDNNANNFKKIFKLAFGYWRNSSWNYIKKYHWFWVTDVNVLIDYPWYSVDSTSWLAACKYWEIHLLINWRIKKVQYKKTNELIKYWKYIPKEFKDITMIQDSNWIKNYKNRLSISAICFREVEKYYTKIWNSRNIKF